MMCPACNACFTNSNPTPRDAPNTTIFIFLLGSINERFKAISTSNSSRTESKLQPAIFSHRNDCGSLSFLRFLLTLPLGQTVYCRYEPAKESALDWNVRRHDQALTQSPAALRRAGDPSAIPR